MAVVMIVVMRVTMTLLMIVSVVVMMSVSHDSANIGLHWPAGNAPGGAGLSSGEETPELLPDQPADKPMRRIALISSPPRSQFHESAVFLLGQNPV